MKAHRKRYILFALILIVGGIAYLAVKQSSSPNHSSDTETTEDENARFKQEENTEANAETRQAEKMTAADDTGYPWENVDGKVSIETASVKDGEIRIRFKNQTKDNVLLSAHFEYARTENGTEVSSIRLDYDGPGLDAGQSETVAWNPQKPLGKTGTIKILELAFQNNQDDYTSEALSEALPES